MNARAEFLGFTHPVRIGIENRDADIPAPQRLRDNLAEPSESDHQCFAAGIGKILVDLVGIVVGNQHRR